MRSYRANYSRKGQMKIQEMAFVLAAIMIFFAIAALFYINFRISGLRQGVEEQRSQEAQEIVKKIASSPELSLNKECESCIDLDKALVLKESKAYKNFWNLDYLKIEVIYPNKKQGECIRGNYPDECSGITIANKTKDFGTAMSAFAALCRYDATSRTKKCELGKIYAAGEALK